jgi:hypothetical protein
MKIGIQRSDETERENKKENNRVKEKLSNAINQIKIHVYRDKN